jgi:hypothetical protein
MTAVCSICTYIWFIGHIKNTSHALLTLVFLEAKRLSSLYTILAGYGTFDIMHVAGALHLKAEKFLTYDLNQRSLANLVGINQLMG